MTSFLNNLLRPTGTSPETSTTYAPYLRKRPGDFEEAAPGSYEQPDKARAVAGPSREEFDRQMKANREAIASNKVLMQEIERLKRLGQEAMDELTRRQNEATQKEAQQLAQEQANADEARIAQEKAQAEADKVEAEMRAHQEALDQQKRWFEQQLEEMKRQCDQVQKEKEERDAEIFNLRNRQRLSGQSPPQGPSSRATQNRSHEDVNMGEGSFLSSQAPPQNTPNTPDLATLVRDSVAAAVAAAFAAQPPPATPQSSPAMPRSRQRRSQVPKPGSTAHRREIKKTALNLLSKDDEKLWRDFLRSCFRQMTQQTNITDFRTYSPIDNTVAEAFEKGEGPGPTDLTRYRLHFGDGYHKSRWNKVIIANMLVFTADKKNAYKVDGDIDDEILKAFFSDFIKEAQTSWARYGRRIGKDDNLETSQEAKERADQYSELHKESCRINSRKHAKLAHRKLGVSLLQNTLPPSASQIDLTKLHQTQQVLDSLGHEGMSSEESDNEGGFIVTIPHYRRRIVSQMMSDLDRDSKTALEYHDRTLRKNNRPRPKFIRRRTEQKSSRTVKKGLPASLYHRHFLSQLSDPVREGLEIPPTDLPNFNQWALTMQANSDSESDEDERM